MDYETYRAHFFVDPPPAPRFHFEGLLGITLYFDDYEAAVAYYTAVLGPPAYVEGDGTRGWAIAQTWLTLLKGGSGRPQNVELSFVLPNPAEAERLQQAFIAAGGVGVPPADQLMYKPIRACSVTDPFGTQIMIYAPL